MNAAPGTCPGCGKRAGIGAANPWRPFCSERCKMADLGQWFAERYAIPEADDADDGPDPDGEGRRPQ